MTDMELLMEAKEARKHAYAPYSHHTVGAALETGNGKIYHGCNIENAAYGPANCAERTAFFKAVYDGAREFARIAVTGGLEEEEGDNPCAPCGICRQVMMEFCDPESFRILMADGQGGVISYTLKELLPLGFGPENLEKKKVTQKYENQKEQ